MEPETDLGEGSPAEESRGGKRWHQIHGILLLSLNSITSSSPSFILLHVQQGPLSKPEFQ